MQNGKGAGWTGPAVIKYFGSVLGPAIFIAASMAALCFSSPDMYCNDRALSISTFLTLFLNALIPLPFVTGFGYGSSKGYRYDVPRAGGAGQKQRKTA